MAIPTGSGTEVMRNGGWATQSTDVTSFQFDGTSPTTGTESYTVPTNHIITILSIIWCETNNTAELLHLQHVQGYILYLQPLAARETFIYNERLSLKSGEFLKTWLGSAGDVDVHYSYIDQDWS